MGNAHRHPVNVLHHDQASLGERLADKAAAGIGSWRFLIIQTFAVLCWVSLNVVGLISRWDPFPFILLNLLFSVQAAYTGPVLLLAGNRQAEKDRLMLEHTFEDAEKSLAELLHNTEVTLQILERLTPTRGAIDA